MSFHPPDRYDVATLAFRFWWVLALFGLLTSAWLLRSIASTFGAL